MKPFPKPSRANLTVTIKLNQNDFRNKKLCRLSIFKS